MKDKMKDPISNQNNIKKDTTVTTPATNPAALVRYEDENFVDTTKAVWNYSLLHDDDVSTFQQGTNYWLYKKFGSKHISVLGREGYHFTVWAPNATKVSVIGNFNNWNNGSHLLLPRWDKSGIWEGFVPDLTKGEVYKFHITGFENRITEKSDPFAIYCEKRPGSSTITWEFDYKWNDAHWMKDRHKHIALDDPWR